MFQVSANNNFKQFPNLPTAYPSPAACPPAEAILSCAENTPCSPISRLLHFKKVDDTIEQLPQLDNQERQLIQDKITQKWRPLHYKGENSFSLQELIIELRNHRVLVTSASLVGEGVFCWTGFSYFLKICSLSTVHLSPLTRNELQEIYSQFQSEAQSPCFRIDIITNKAEAKKVLEMYGAQIKEEGSLSCWVVSRGNRLLITIRTPECRVKEEHIPILHAWSITHTNRLFFEKKESIYHPLFIFKRQINPLYLKNYPLDEGKNVVQLCKEFCHGYQIHDRSNPSATKEQAAAIRTACQKAQLKANGNTAQGWLDILESVDFESSLEYLFTAYHLCLFLQNKWKSEDAETFWKLLGEHKRLKSLKKEEETLGAFLWTGLVQLKIPFEKLHSWLLLHGLFSAHCHKIPNARKKPVCEFGSNNGTINLHFVCNTHVSKLHLQIPLESIWNHFNRINHWIKGPIPEAAADHLAKLFPTLLHEIRLLPVSDMPLYQEEAHLGTPVQFLKAFSKDLIEGPRAIGHISGFLFMALSMSLESPRFEDFFPIITLLLQNKCPTHLERYFQLALKSIPIRAISIEAAIQKYIRSPQISSFNQLMREIQVIDPVTALKFFRHCAPDLSLHQTKDIALLFGREWILLSGNGSSLVQQIHFLKLCIELKFCPSILGRACVRFLSFNQNVEGIRRLQLAPYIAQIVAFLDLADRKLFQSFFIPPFSEPPVFKFLLKIDPLLALAFLSKTTKELDTMGESIERMAKDYAKGQKSTSLLEFLHRHLVGLEETHLLRYFCTVLIEELIFHSKDREARQFIEMLPAYLPKRLIKLVTELSMDTYLNESQQAIEDMVQKCDAEKREKRGKNSIYFRFIQLIEAQEDLEVQRLVFDLVSRRKELALLDRPTIFNWSNPHSSSTEWLVNKATAVLRRAVSVRDFESVQVLLNCTNWQKVTKRSHALVLKELLNLNSECRKDSKTPADPKISLCLEEAILFNASRMKKFEWEQDSAKDFATFLNQLTPTTNFSQALLISILESARHFLSLLPNTRTEALFDLLKICTKNCALETSVENWIDFSNLRLRWMQSLEVKQRIPLRDALLQESCHYLNASEEVAMPRILNVLMATLFTIPSHALTLLDAAISVSPQLAIHSNALYLLGFKRALKNHDPLVAWEFLKKTIDHTQPPPRLIKRFLDVLFKASASEIISHLLQHNNLIPRPRFAITLCDYIDKFLILPPEAIASQKKRHRLLTEAMALVSKYPKETLSIFERLIQQDLQATHVETLLEIWENNSNLYKTNNLNGSLEFLLATHAPLALKYLSCPIHFATLFGLSLKDAGAVFSRLFQTIVQLAHEDIPFAQRISLMRIFQIREELVTTAPSAWSLFEKIDPAILQACRQPKCTLTQVELANCVVELFGWQTLNTIHDLELQKLNLQFLRKMQQLKLELTFRYQEFLLIISMERPPETIPELIQLIDLSGHFSHAYIPPLLNQLNTLINKKPQLIPQNETIFKNKLPKVFQRLLNSYAYISAVVLSLLGTYHSTPIQTLREEDAHLKCYCQLLYAAIDNMLTFDYESVRDCILSYITTPLGLLRQKRNIAPMNDQLVLALAKKEIETMRLVDTFSHCKENKDLIFSLLNLNNPQACIRDQDKDVSTFISFHDNRVKLFTNLISAFLQESYLHAAEKTAMGVRGFFAVTIGILLEIVLKNTQAIEKNYLVEHTDQIGDYFGLLTHFTKIDGRARQVSFSILTTWSQRYFPRMTDREALNELKGLVNNYSKICKLSNENKVVTPSQTEWIITSLLNFVSSKNLDDLLRLLKFMEDEKKDLFKKFSKSYQTLFSHCINQFCSQSIAWYTKNDVISKLVATLLDIEGSDRETFFEMHLQLAGLLKTIFDNTFKGKRWDVTEENQKLVSFLPLIKTYRKSLNSLYRNNERIFIDNPEFSIHLADTIMDAACVEDYEPLVTRVPYEDVFSSQLFYHLLVNQKSSALTEPLMTLRLNTATKWIKHMGEMSEHCQKHKIPLSQKLIIINGIIVRFAGYSDDTEIFNAFAKSLKPQRAEKFHQK